MHQYDEVNFTVTGLVEVNIQASENNKTRKPRLGSMRAIAFVQVCDGYKKGLHLIKLVVRVSLIFLCLFYMAVNISRRMIMPGTNK